jgi:hypothetical protein
VVVFFVQKEDFPFGGISKYASENECFFSFWKIKLAPRRGVVEAHGF